MSATEKPRRLTVTDAYMNLVGLMHDMATRAPSDPSASVEITRNAAGNAQFTVKTYAPATADEAAVKTATERAYNQAVDAYDALNVAYPHVDPKAAK